jgi:predicted ribonuclease toxin of YeeF-YezG toxin-antitoxin module
MPSTKNYVRDLPQERKTAIARGDTGVGSESKDATRHRARRKVIASLKKKGKAHTAVGKDVDHKRKLSEGGSNSISNLRLRKPSENRSDNRPKRKT